MEEAQRRMRGIGAAVGSVAQCARKSRSAEQQGSAQRQRAWTPADGRGAGHDRSARQTAGPVDWTGATGHPAARDLRQPAPTGDPDAQREADRRVQQALRRALGELMQQFGDLTGEMPPSLTEADQAMRESASQLGRGDGQEPPVRPSSEAIEALQKGAREMGQAMARQFGRRGQGGEARDRGRWRRRRPQWA